VQVDREHGGGNTCYTEQVGVAVTLGRCLVRRSVGKPAIMTEVLRGFPQSLQANAGIATPLDHDRLLPTPFQFIIHLSPCHSTLYT
jgi:hypothetical protein